MRSSSAERRGDARAARRRDARGGDADGVGGVPGDAEDAPVLGRWGRLVLGTLLVGAALLGPAMGFASATFGDTATVTISITIAPTPGAPTGSPTPAPTATLPEPAPPP